MARQRCWHQRITTAGLKARRLSLAKFFPSRDLPRTQGEPRTRHTRQSNQKSTPSRLQPISSVTRHTVTGLDDAGRSSSIRSGQRLSLRHAEHQETPRQHLVIWGRGMIVGWLRSFDDARHRVTNQSDTSSVYSAPTSINANHSAVSARQPCGIQTNTAPARNRAYRQH